MVALFVGIPQRLNQKLRCLADVNDSFSGMTMSCQVSNVTLVEVNWECFYASVEARMIKPVSILAYFALEPLRKLAQMINKLTIQVLDAPLNLAFVLRIRRMRKMRFNTVLTTPALPLLLKLAAMIGKNSFRQILLLL